MNVSLLSTKRNIREVQTYRTVLYIFNGLQNVAACYVDEMRRGWEIKFKSN